jgi:phospholipid N-methyltransferase
MIVFRKRETRYLEEEISSPKKIGSVLQGGESPVCTKGKRFFVQRGRD